MLRRLEKTAPGEGLTWQHTRQWNSQRLAVVAIMLGFNLERAAFQGVAAAQRAGCYGLIQCNSARAPHHFEVLEARQHQSLEQLAANATSSNAEHFAGLDLQPPRG